MKNARFIIHIAILMIFVSANYVAADTREEMIAKYIKLSGAENALASLPVQLEALSFQNITTSKKPQTDRKAIELLKQAFDSEQARKELFQFISMKMDESLLQNLLVWYESPLGQKVVSEESSSSGADKQAKILRYLASMQDNPPAFDRITLIQNVESTTQLSELTTNIIIKIMKGMLKSINLSLPKEKQVEDVNIEKYISNERPLIKEESRKQMILSLYYTFRNFTNDEIKQYIAFYKTKAGQEEIEITGGAFFHVLNEWVAVATDKIVAYVKSESEKSKE